MRLVVPVVGVVMVELRPKREGTPRVASEGTGGDALLPRGSVRGSRQGRVSVTNGNHAIAGSIRAGRGHQ